MKSISSFSLLSLALSASTAGAFTVSIDPHTTTRVIDVFNDGLSTATGFNNMSDGGEAGGFATGLMPPGAVDPQLQFPTPGPAFDITSHPFLRIGTRGSVGGPSQVFPLPPAAPTVLNYNTGTAFAESQMTFIAPANGTGLRIDPLGGGTATNERFDFDYIMVDRVRTIGLAEFDHDGALDGWTVVGGLTGSASAATSTFAGTTNGVDPILQRGGLNIDTSVFQTIEIRAAFDPASTSRFEMFWGTNTFPGPAGGQSVVMVNELIRDGNLHTYRIDMSDEAAWDGNLNILRIDPLADADAAAGRDFEIAYVRLLEGSNIIPEPSTGMLALAGLACVLLRRRR